MNLFDSAVFRGGAMLLTVAMAGAFNRSMYGAPLKIMSFNIRGDFDLEVASNSPEAWNSLSDNHRRDLVVKTIAAYNPDLFGVQEAFQHQLVDLNAVLSGYEFSGVGRDDGKKAGEHSAVFYRADRFHRVRSGSFWLSNSPDESGSIFPGAGYSRIASWVILADHRAGGNEFVVLDTHWDNVSEAARQHAAKLIRERIKRLAGGRPVVVMGDLNDSEDSVSVKTLLDANSAELPLYDSFREVYPKRGDDEASFHNFGGKTAGSRIDFILHSGDLKATDAGIVHTDFDGRYPSDHFPVTAVLEFIE